MRVVGRLITALDERHPAGRPFAMSRQKRFVFSDPPNAITYGVNSTVLSQSDWAGYLADGWADNGDGTLSGPKEWNGRATTVRPFVWKNGRVVADDPRRGIVGNALTK